MKAIESQTSGLQESLDGLGANNEYEQPLYSRRETLLTMMGVLLVMLLASLDQTNYCQDRSCPQAARSTRTRYHRFPSPLLCLPYSSIASIHSLLLRFQG